MSNRTSQVTMPAFFPALVFLGIFVVLLVLLMPEPVAPQYAAAAKETATAVEVAALPTATELPPTPLPPTEEVAAAAYTAAQISEGQGIIQSACSACHGLDARGITGLGKDLLASSFVHSLSDDELLTFITTGRDTSDPLNTTGIPMPSRGGNPSLTDDQLRAVIAYLRTNAVDASTGSAAPTAQPTVVAAAPSATSAPLEAPILPTTIPVTPQPFTAQGAYTWSCAGCHGADGAGNLPFAGGFLQSSLLDDRAALLNFLSAAHPPTAPNVEYQHIYRGGYPELTDEQLAALADYVLTLKSE